MRHEEYIKDKMKYAGHKVIAKKDKIYIAKNPNKDPREFISIIKEPILDTQNDYIVTKDFKLTLQNMDGYFYNMDYNRRINQEKIVKYI